MVRPRPVPPKRRVVEASAWVKGAKIEDCLSEDADACVGHDEVEEGVQAVGFLDAHLEGHLAVAGDLMALPRRLRTIWRSPGRIAYYGLRDVRGDIASQFEAFLMARSATLRVASSRLSRRLNSIGSSSTLPASILEKSRMSLMMASSESAEARAVSMSSRCSGVSTVSRASSVIPRTPFMGVRISWLMLARN